MARKPVHTEGLSKLIERHRGLVVPIAAAAMVLIVLTPLPPAVMDLLLSASLALAALILLTAIFVDNPLQFSVFPSVVLGVTLLRLVLNVATTRLILTAGADGAGPLEAQLAAGRVVWSFSRLVASGSLAVGLILFALISIIQFVVITRGAGRISEVAARFVLDAMPGKQAAVASDLAAGLLTQDQARRRREEIVHEADFYGAMDGASKFIRGDAIAAAVIVLVNLLGGLYVGMVQHGWSLRDTAELFSRLTIGDGLVMQVPALIVSVGTALIVSRSSARTDLGREVLSQLSARPGALAITAAFLVVLAFTSLPRGPLLAIGAGLAGLAVVLTRRSAAEAAERASAPREKPVQNVKDLLGVDPIRIDLGLALVRLLDDSAGPGLLECIAAFRKRMALDLGLIVPPIRIRDDIGLDTRGYVIHVRGVKVASGRLYPGQVLVVGSGKDQQRLLGRPGTEPASGAEAVWVSHSQRAEAEAMDYAVLEPSEVLTAHLEQAVRRHVEDLLTRRHVVELLEGLKPACASLVTEAVEKLSAARIQRVLQALLREQVPIRDLEAILEALVEAAEHTDRVEELIEHARSAVARQLCQQHAEGEGKLICLSLSGDLEQQLVDYISDSPGSVGGGVIPPEFGEKLAGTVTGRLEEMRRQGKKPIVLCAPQVRSTLRRLVAASMPEAVVLGYNEIESVEVESVGKIGI
jgi:flagellar biosynthesis protein FlhA